MKPKISKKTLDSKCGISPIKQIMCMADPKYFEKVGWDVSEIISFAGGWVNHSSSEDLRDAYRQIIENKALFHKSGGYSPISGTREYKEAIIKFERYLYGVENLNVSQLIIGASSTQLLYDVLRVLLDPGDKILLLDPSYCNLPTQIITAFAASDISILRFPVLNPDSWHYCADEKTGEFSRFILKEKPKVILLISPDNPTSQVLSDKFVSAALSAVRETGSFLLVDFAYKELIFDEKYPEYFSWAPNDNFLSIHSNSKWCRGLGRRLGWLEASAEIVEAMEFMQGSSVLSPDMLHQMAFTEYINKAVDEDSLKNYISETKRVYREAAEETSKAIEEYLRLPYLVPQGGLYTCMKVGMDGTKFVEAALKETGVLFVPGWGFGKTLENGVRVAYGPLINNLENIKRGLAKIARFFKK